MPTYREFPVGLATRGHLRRLMAAFAPDVVHLASPAWLGHQAGEAARSLGIPVVAVYQTDLIGFAERYPFPGAAGAMRSLTRRVHGPADCPSDTAKLSVATSLRKAAHGSISAAGRVRASAVVAGCAYRIG